ncbi:biliverdin-producing heme oxygenase [Streptomyces sp. NPDC047072]|uniref:biliverdin-producing heme oxygenase n=1 Tax=Streptomyces sp. NPDC047072 TaxID=3154809 RepID=UPI0033E8F037
MTASLSETLRAGTRGRHDALEATAFARALLSGTLPLERYVAQLTAYRLVLGALEDELSRAPGPAVTEVWSAELVKLPLVERDLRYFAERGTVAGPGACGEASVFARGTAEPRVAEETAEEGRAAGAARTAGPGTAQAAGPGATQAVEARVRQAAQAFVAEIRHTAAVDPDALLGFLYVLEGSTLGALVLHRHVCTAYGLCAPDGVSYYGCGDHARWARFTGRMNAAVTDPGVRLRIADAAERAYRHTLTLTTALSSGLPLS